MSPRHPDITAIRAHIPAPGASYDVIVAGGGPAGLGAAYGAARQGARVLLLEARSFLGGVAQLGLWMPMNRLFKQGESRGGIQEALVAKLTGYGDDACCRGIDNKYAKDGLDIHPDYLRLAAFELLEEVGAHYRLYSPVTGAIKEGDAVTGVRVTDKQGTHAFYAGVTVDATGDGDVAHHAGAEMRQGREEDGRTMPISLSFAVANTDAERALAYINDPEGRAAFDELIARAYDEGYYTAQWYYFDRTTVPGVLSVNNGGPRETWDDPLDGTDPRDLATIERLGIRIAVDFVRLARDKGIPGLESCSLVRVGPQVGVRETRRTVGDYVFRGEDAVAGTRFDDAILLRYGEHIDGQYFTKPIVTGHQFPYRALLPKGVENLLMAGRCASYTHEGHAAARSMGNMLGMGQAAGVAAAISVQDGVTPRAVDVSKVQQALVALGAELSL
jgi:hypothetical protein